MTRSEFIDRAGDRCQMTIPSNLLQVNSTATECVHQVASQRVIVIDNVLRYPDALLQLAGCLDYGLNVVPGRIRYFPGERAYISVWPRPILEHILSRLNECNQTNHTLDEFVKYPLTFSKINSESVRSIQSHQVVPHLDFDSVVSAVLYLSHSDSDIPSGTAFYRHVATGLAYSPPHPDDGIAELMRRRGLSPVEPSHYFEFRKQLMQTNLHELEPIKGSTAITQSTRDWEVVCRVDQKFNRLVIFPSHLFHSPVYTFTGHTAADRVTLNFFLTRC
jgi:hypothetical protein